MIDNALNFAAYDDFKTFVEQLNDTERTEYQEKVLRKEKGKKGGPTLVRSGVVKSEIVRSDKIYSLNFKEGIAPSLRLACNNENCRFLLSFRFKKNSDGAPINIEKIARGYQISHDWPLHWLKFMKIVKNNTYHL